MNFKRTRAFFSKIRGKKTANGLSINSSGKTPNGTPITGINHKGKPVTTRHPPNGQGWLNNGNGGFYRNTWNGMREYWK